MLRTVLLALCSLAVVSAQEANSRFQLQNPSKFVVTSATTPKECFESTKTTIPFQYSVPGSTDSTGNTITPATPEKSCGATGATGRMTDLFSDRVWAVKRNGGVDTGDCLDLWNGADEKPDGWTSQADYLTDNAGFLKPGEAGDVLNVPYRLIITRQLWACRYDSNMANGGTGGNFNAGDRTTAAATPKVALRREQWQIYHMDFASTALNSLIPAITAGATVGNVWSVPSSDNSSPTENTNFYKAFADGESICQTQSKETCKPGATTNCGSGDKIESYACASSAQLLARAGQTSVTPADTWKTFAGLSKDIFGPEVDGKAGLIADLWASVSTTIASFKGTTIDASRPTNLVPGRTLSFVNGEKYQVVLNNFQKATGFFPGSNFNAQVGIVAGTPKVFSTSSSSPVIPVTPDKVAFNPTTSAIDIVVGTDLDYTSGTASSSSSSPSATNLPQTHYWASLQTSFTLQANFSCTSIGTTAQTPTAAEVEATDSTTYGRFRYNCGETYNEAVFTPGRKYNDNTNQYPAVRRLYRGFGTEQSFNPINNAINVNNLKADPVYIGFLNSLANTNSYRMAGIPSGINGARDEKFPKLFERRGIIVSDQASGWFMWGVATVLIAVFFPLSFCLGSAIVGKLGGGSGGKNIDVNFSGTKNRA